MKESQQRNQLCLGHVFSAKAHLRGMLSLLKERKRHWQRSPEQDEPLYENSEEEEHNDRYYLLLHSLFTRNVSRLINSMCYAEFPQTYHAVHSEKLLALASRLDHVEKNCYLTLKLDALCLMQFLSRALQTEAISRWIDGTDTVRDLQDLTDSLDMILSKRSFSESENEFAAGCANGVASQLHIQYVAAHLASISSCKEIQKARGQTSTEAVTVSKSTCCSEKTFDDYVFHILRDALVRHFAKTKDCMAADGCLLFWQVFLGVICVDIRFQRSASMGSEFHTPDSDMLQFFDQGIRRLSQACHIRQWAGARATLQKIAWPIIYADERIAKAVWERAHLS
ncbi:hypothetical protein V8C34DRAFT_318798 [Trichoderma compactum]